MATIMKLDKLCRKTNEFSEIELNSNMNVFTPRTALAAYVCFYYEQSPLSFSEWIHGLEIGIDNFLKSERCKDICWKITSSGGQYIYCDDNFCLTIQSQSL